MNSVYRQSLKQYEVAGILSKTTLIEELRLVAKELPDKLALIGSDKSLSYKQLIAEVEAYSRRFETFGMTKNDQVLLQLPNETDYVVVLFALFNLGISPVLMLPTHREAEIIAIGNLIEATTYISTSDHLGIDYSGIIKNCLPEVPSIHKIIIKDLQSDSSETDPQWFDLTGQNKPAIGIEHVDLCHFADPAVYLLSGGTTGIPKIIPKIHEAYVYNAKAAAERCHFDQQTVYLAVLSASHDLALANPGILGTLFAGGTVVMSKSASFDEAFQLIDEYQVTVTTLVPAIINMWSTALEWFPGDFSSLQQIIVGAAKIDEQSLRTLITKMGVKIQQGYGLGEGITCFTSLDDREEVVFKTQGKPISVMDEMKIIDESSRELPAGEVGELIEKGPYTFGGYYKNEQLNQKSFTKDGFFKTGDKAKITAEGDLVILGRVVEQINKAGENIIPAEIEEYLEKCSAISKACVFGLPDEQLGEKIVACVIVSKPLNKKAIRTELSSKGIAAFKIPDEFVEVNEFPLKNIGKVDKESLKMRVMREGI